MAQSPRFGPEELARFEFDGLSEQAIREQWIYPLLMLLGYGLGTRNGVEIPLTLELRPALRMLGSHRWEADYRPTVLGTGLWIIEAKRPDEDPFAPDHLGQAWCYATDPRVRVPLMVMTNGRVIGVFDLTREEWDEPVLHMEHRELTERFAELESVLGARQVAEFVRRSQLSYLALALEAQVDEDVLDNTVEDVRGIAERARPRVRANRNELWFSSWQAGDAEWRRTVRRAGVGAWVDIANSIFVPVGADIDQCVEMIRELPVDHRPTPLGELTAPRMMYALRIFRLSVALHLTDDDGCAERAREIAEHAVRDHVLNFPDSPIDAAAHRFELALVPGAARMILAGATNLLKEKAAEIRDRLDSYRYVELEAAHGVSADRMAGRSLDLAIRRVWNEEEPWTVEHLDELAERFRGIAERLGPQRGLAPGQILNEHFDVWLEHPPLLPTTRNVLTNVEKYAGSDVVRAFARDLRGTYFEDG